MKSFAAASIAAYATALQTPEVGMPLMALPEFVSGFLFGMVGDNNLTEIQTCYTGSEVIFKDLELTIGDLLHKDITDVVIELGDIVKLLPADLNNCEHMQDDVLAIEQWSQIFHNKAALIADVTKHYALHRKAIKSDIALTKSDWELGSYYKAGVDAADLLTIAVGPIEPANEVAIADNSLMAIPDFAAGFVYGFVGDNNMVEFEACFTGAETTIADFELALADLEAGDILKFTVAAKHAMSAFHDDMAACEGMGDDVYAFEQWAQMFKDPKTLIAKAGKNYLLHKRRISKDIADEKADWSLGEYFQAGEATADAITAVLGPVEQPAMTFSSQSNGLATAVPDWIAGFIYGMTGDNDLTEIEACFQGTDLMYKEINTAIEDFGKGGWDYITQGILEISLAALQFPQALSTCEGMGDDITAIEQWAQIFTDPVKLSAVVGKNWLLHKRRIENDAADTKADWEAQNYFQSGVDAADLATTAVGPIN